MSRLSWLPNLMH